ncbi:coiled-coil domain-containing protein 106-like [Gymnodraco acuticeps]|uniref:Coiled-coil domain-containing protein 106-like n=1 Tax=Gymnodraco acuticeps TaxID=8218 RepID=A0A6P8UTJ2_GYMAC|nr:coiled-coil domain-containing protein 106-like [Gymnodraco acuticeps]
MGQERLSGLALLSIESDRAKKLDIQRIVDEFAERKARRPKAKKKNQVPKEESRMELIKEDLDGPEDTESLAPSCSTSLGSGSISRLEFLEAKIEWQDKMIKDLEGERNFLREQVLGLKKKSTQSKVPTLEEDVSMSEDDTSQSPADLSDSSDSDVVIPKKKQRNTRNPASPDVAVRAHMRVKGPAEVVHRYKKVLKTFGHVRTMSEAFRRNNVDR